MKKSVFITFFTLCGAIVLLSIIAKLFYADFLVIQITNSRLLAIGNYLDSHFWLLQGIYFITTYLVYFLYLCAVCQKWRYSLKEFLVLTPIIIAMQFIKIYAPAVGMYLDLIAMILIPFVMKAELKNKEEYLKIIG